MKQKQLKKKKASETIKKEPYKRRWGNQFSKAYTDEEIEKLGDELLEWMESDPKNLWFKDFCVNKRISGQRISEFAEKNEYFRWLLSFCKDIQESRMFKAGTSRTINPAMFILGLKNNHKWQDQHQQQPLSDNELDKLRTMIYAQTSDNI